MMERQSDKKRVYIYPITLLKEDETHFQFQRQYCLIEFRASFLIDSCLFKAKKPNLSNDLP